MEANLKIDVPEMALISYKLEAIMALLTELQTEVTNIRGVANSAIALINGLSDRLDLALADDDPAAVAALAAELRQSATDLAAAVEANPVP